MKKLHLFVALAFAGVFAVSAAAQANETSTENFVRSASIANMFEIESSKIVLGKSENSEIKRFAQRMVDDHSATGRKLKQVLSASDTQLEPASELDSRHQNLVNQLQAASVADIDRHYIDIQTDAHKEAVELFRDYSKNGSDARLKNFASETLPKLEEHLEHVKRLNQRQ